MHPRPQRRACTNPKPATPAERWHPYLRDYRGQKPRDALAKFCTFKKPLKLKDGMIEQEWRETAVDKPLH